MAFINRVLPLIRNFPLFDVLFPLTSNLLSKHRFQHVLRSLLADGDNLFGVLPFKKPWAVQPFWHRGLWPYNLQSTSSASSSLLLQFGRLRRRVLPTISVEPHGDALLTSIQHYRLFQQPTGTGHIVPWDLFLSSTRQRHLPRPSKGSNMGCDNGCRDDRRGADIISGYGIASSGGLRSP